MSHGNPPEYWERVVSRHSKGAIKAFEIFGCHEPDQFVGGSWSFPCLPVDRKRIIFVTCKNKYKNKVRTYYGCNNDNASTFGERYQGDNEVLMRCPLDCAVRGSALDDGKRYNEIRERTKRGSIWDWINCYILHRHDYSSGSIYCKHCGNSCMGDR